MTAEVHVLPGIERRDLLEPLPSEQLLQKAIENGVTDVVIVGRSRDSTLYVATGDTDVDRAVGLLVRATTFLSSGTVVNDQVLELKED